MDINVDGHEYHSVPFNYNKADTLLLKLKGQVHMGTLLIDLMPLSSISCKRSKLTSMSLHQLMS